MVGGPSILYRDVAVKVPAVSFNGGYLFIVHYFQLFTADHLLSQCERPAETQDNGRVGGWPGFYTTSSSGTFIR